MPINLYSNINIPMKIAIFASGSGTNFEKIYERQKQLEKQSEINFANVNLVFSNNPDAEVLKKAESYGIKTISLSSKKFFELLGESPNNESHRKTYDAAVISLIEQYLKPDLIVLAGYRRKLSELFINKYKNKIINLYPGDITKNYLVTGKQAFVQAVENNEDSLRCTCYIENEPTKRFGTAIAQSKKISLKNHSKNKTADIGKKIREEGEWQLFPFVVHDLIANGRVKIDEKNIVYVDGKKMNEKGFLL